MLKGRFLSALVGLPLLVAALWVGGTALLLVTLVLAGLAGHEWWRLATAGPNLWSRQGSLSEPGLTKIIFFAGLLLMVLVSGVTWGGMPAPFSIAAATAPGTATLGRVGLVPAIGLLAYALLWTMVTLGREERGPTVDRSQGPAAPDLPHAGSSGAIGPAGPVPGAGLLAVGWLYVGFTFAHWLALRQLGDVLPGVQWPPGPILWTVVLVWVGDTAAYFAGHRWGRRALAPTLSPRKSVEGAVAGLAAAVLAAVLLRHWPGRDAITAALIGAIVALCAQAGDLWESALKRSAGVKDSGTLLPGHGGILDRFDGLLLALPASYYLLTWLPW